MSLYDTYFFHFLALLRWPSFYRCRLCRKREPGIQSWESNVKQRALTIASTNTSTASCFLQCTSQVWKIWTMMTQSKYSCPRKVDGNFNFIAWMVNLIAIVTFDKKVERCIFRIHLHRWSRWFHEPNASGSKLFVNTDCFFPCCRSWKCYKTCRRQPSHLARFVFYYSSFGCRCQSPYGACSTKTKGSGKDRF